MSQITTTCFIALLFFGCITAQISHEKWLETVRAGRNKIIKCNVDSSVSPSSTVLHLYRQRPGEAIRRIMHFAAGATSATNENDIPSRLNGRIRGQTVSLTISSAQREDEATYYCALWKGDTVLKSGGEAVHKPGGASQIEHCALHPYSRYLLSMSFLFPSVHSAEKLEQKVLMTKAAAKLAIIECRFSANCLNYVHWYQKKEDELKRVQYVDINDGTTRNNPVFEYLKSARKGIRTFVLKIPDLKPEHSATYYCACWTGYHIFGSGTRLYVSDSLVQPPKLSAYPISRPNNGKRTLLCQARGMFPDQVKFTWKDESGTEVKQSDTYDLLEQKDEGQEVRVTSMLIIDPQKASSKTYTCFVQHEHEKDIVISTSSSDEEKKDDVEPSPGPAPTCAPSQNKQQDQEDENEEHEQEENDGSEALVHRTYLFSLTYLTLLGKNVLYFFAVCVILYKKRAGNSETVSQPGQVNKPRAS
ncbi:uncharacterized protein LOC118825371 [Colossoma macropomum]|uniref:uncharacterized protein LOC118825371 n=1 Tax=Colossoma macropomum TaxID=42526 RepID=UPI001863EA18|nr:uncharacterized protein LOC118825371 [Colossoma macropomum]